MRKPVILERLLEKTKAEIMDAALRLGLPPLKSRAKKADWADHVAGGLETHLENLLLQLPLEAVDALREALNGGLTVPVEPSTAEVPGLLQAIFVLEDCGLAEASPGLCTVEDCIPALLALDEADRAQQRLQDNLFDYMDGWLLHVGMMPLEELLGRAVALMELPQAHQEGAELLCHALLIARNGERAVWEDDTGTLWATSQRLEDPQLLYQRLRQPAIAAMDYPEFDEDALAFSARESLLPGRVKLYLPLLDWLETRDVEDPDGLIIDAVLMAQNEQVNEAVQMLLGQAVPQDIADANRAVGLLIELFNSIPRWSCKGHSPKGLVEAMKPRRTARMPGRNDPCPCGSGKKYKQCCGQRLN